MRFLRNLFFYAAMPFFGKLYENLIVYEDVVSVFDEKELLKRIKKKQYSNLLNLRQWQMLKLMSLYQEFIEKKTKRKLIKIVELREDRLHNYVKAIAHLNLFKSSFIFFEKKYKIYEKKKNSNSIKRSF